MSTAIKNNRLSSEDKTAEFELPPLGAKINIVPPTPAVQQKVHALRSENKEIKTQIDQVKSDTVRKQDESTRVFNLRQAQLVQKIKDLELRKVQTEKVIQKMMDEKSQDLAKTSKTLEDLGGGMEKIGNIRNELQNLFEHASQDRKNNAQTLQDQAAEIQKMQSLLEATHVLMAKEYVELGSALRPLMTEKIDIEKSYVQLKSEVSQYQTTLQDLANKKAELESVMKTIENNISEAHQEEKTCSEKTHTLHQNLETLQKDLEAREKKLEDAKNKKEDLQRAIADLKEQQDQYTRSGESLKWSLVTLNEQYEQKKTSLKNIDQDMIDLKKRIEELRTHESHLVKSCGQYTTTLNHLQGEVAGLEAARASALKVQEEAMDFLSERREFYFQQTEELEKTHTSKVDLLEREYQQQKADWEKNFLQFEETQRVYMENKLQEQTTAYHLVLKQTQQTLLDDISKVVKRHLTRTVFESGQQRAELAQDEIAPLLKNYFNQLPISQEKPWQNWKPWFYATSSSLFVITCLVAKIIWF